MRKMPENHFCHYVTRIGSSPLIGLQKVCGPAGPIPQRCGLKFAYVLRAGHNSTVQFVNTQEWSVSVSTRLTEKAGVPVLPLNVQSL